MALTKCINSESKQYKPVLVDKLILDDVPTVNSLNAITSDAVARAVAGASGEVPAVTENDNGKVLKAVYDAGGPAVEWGEAAPAVTVDQTYNALSENAQSGVAVAEAIAGIPAPVEVVTNQNSFELEGDNPVKVEFTRVEDTSVIIHTTVDLTPGSPVDDDNQTMVIAFDLNAVNKSVDDDGPVLKINTALPANSGLRQFQWGFNDSVSTSDNYSNYIQAGSNTSYGFPSGEIDLCNPGTIGTRSYSRTRGIESNTKRYFIVKAVFDSPYKSAISTWMSNGNITIKDWPKDGYGNKVVIPNIPASTSADENKVLTVDAQGEPQWQTAQGGGSSYTAGTGIDINGNDIISVKYQPQQFNAGTSFDYASTSYYTISGYSGDNALQTKLTGMTISSSYCYGKFILVFSQEMTTNVEISSTGIESSTGWTILAFDATDPANNYAYATESYEYASTSTNRVTVANGYQPDRYYVFTFDQSNAHGTISGSTCFSIVPKPGEGFTGNSPWGVPLATGLRPNGTYTNTEPYLVGQPTSGSGLVDKTYLRLISAIPRFSKYTDVGKVLQVQSDGTLAWVTLS